MPTLYPSSSGTEVEGGQGGEEGDEHEGNPGGGMNSPYRLATELQRPPPYSVVEKNWFIFWDDQEKMYAHYEFLPTRSFAKIDHSGAAGRNLAEVTESHDQKCLRRYLPKAEDMRHKPEDVHQATNSLSVVLCRRRDPECVPSSGNTVVMTIVHHKTYYDYHGEYEPYVVLFRGREPFEVFGVSKKPLWIQGKRRLRVRVRGQPERGFPHHGRGNVNTEDAPAAEHDALRGGNLGREDWHAHGQGVEGKGKKRVMVKKGGLGIGRPPIGIPSIGRKKKRTHSDMFYVSSINWRDRGRRHKGYLDDVVMLGFGIEDHGSGGMDVVVGDLIGGFGRCDEPAEGEKEKA